MLMLSHICGITEKISQHQLLYRFKFLKILYMNDFLKTRVNPFSEYKINIQA